MWCVMCCGCRALLAEDGGLVRFLHGWHTGTPAVFDSKEACDTEALKHGWTVKDELGPNHRCPECAEAKLTEILERPRGAYVRAETVL